MDFDTDFKDQVVSVFNNLAQLTFKTAAEHGFEEEYNFPEKIALMHSELSEALEYYRKGNKPSDHIPSFTGIEEEFADTIIRIFSDTARHGYRLGEAVLAKMEFNENRPFKHGNKKC